MTLSAFHHLLLILIIFNSIITLLSITITITHVSILMKAIYYLYPYNIINITFDEMKLIYIINDIHHVVDLQSLSLLHLGHLSTHSCQVFHKHLSSLSDQYQCFFTHHLMFFIFLHYLSNSIQRQLHKLP